MVILIAVLIKANAEQPPGVSTGGAAVIRAALPPGDAMGEFWSGPHSRLKMPTKRWLKKQWEQERTR
jgi:hypothetical protein